MQDIQILLSFYEVEIDHDKVAAMSTWTIRS
jgi:hypothetical protein